MRWMLVSELGVFILRLLGRILLLDVVIIVMFVNVTVERQFKLLGLG